MHGKEDSSIMMRYERDIIIQLRLHPMSLQRPANLPNIEVVKDKLNLDDVIDSTALSDKNIGLTTYQSSLKTDYCNLKHEYPYYPPYLNRLNSYNYPYLYNRAYQNGSSKFRSSFHTYCNAFKKPCYKDSCYKKFSDESLWTKQCYLNSEDIWNCYPNPVHSTHSKSKEEVDDVPKSKKKLSIIDPVTGKDILDDVTPTPSETNRDSCAAQENSKCSENDIASGEKYTGDYFCNIEVIDEFKEVPENFRTSYTNDRVFSKNEKDIFTDQAEYIDMKLKDASKLEGASDKATTELSKDEDCDVEALCDSEITSENVHSELKSCQSMKSTPEANKLLSRPLSKFFQANESKSINIHGNCLDHGRKVCISQISKKNVLKESDFVRENLRQLKEKINTLTQEHQKVAIMQSFLRYKKFKLEETARNLDEKRIEIANWECNLLKKAKELFEKEEWLKKKEKLQCKEQELAEWEKSSNKEIKKEPSQDFHNYKNDEKEPLFPESQFGLGRCSKASWDEAPVNNVYKGEDNEEFTYFSSTPNRVGSNLSSIVRCVSDASSLDELENNVVFMEKMSPPTETNNSSFDDKLDHASFNVNKKKDDIPSCEALGYSKGRRYLPEHMKYWLNKRDRSTM